MKLSNSVVALLALGFVAVGCAGGGGGPSISSSKGGFGPGSASGTVTASDITDNASTFSQMYDRTAPTNPGGRNILGQFDFNSMTIAAASDYDSCSVIEGSSTDKDAANIPYNYSVKYACNGITVGTSTVTQSGGYTLKSKATNSTDLYAGFVMEFLIAVETTATDHTSVGKYGVKIDAGLADTTYSIIAQSTAEQSFVPESYHAAYTTGTKFSYAWTAPAGTSHANIFQEGTAVFSGFYRLNMTGKTVVFKYESADLTYDAATCTTTLYKSGTMTFTDGSGNKLVNTYTNCTRTSTFNGTAI